MTNPPALGRIIGETILTITFTVVFAAWAICELARQEVSIMDKFLIALLCLGWIGVIVMAIAEYLAAHP